MTAKIEKWIENAAMEIAAYINREGGGSADGIVEIIVAHAPKEKHQQPSVSTPWLGCNICAGEKILPNGKPCGCKTGTIFGEVQFLREQAFITQLDKQEPSVPVKDLQTALAYQGNKIAFIKDLIRQAEEWK